MPEDSAVVEIRSPAPAQLVETITGTAVIVDITGASGPGSGPAAPAARAARFDQAIPATVWTIEHGLGFDPAGLVVLSTDGFVLDGFGVQYLAAGASLRLSFDIAVSGVAYLS